MEGDKKFFVKGVTYGPFKPDAEGNYLGPPEQVDVDLASARRSDLKTFARFFRACLRRGIYFAPSQFETGFISTAHLPEDIERTGGLVREALREL